MNSSCKKVPSKFVLINDISLHILILFTILSSLFVFYISKKETEAINGEIIEYIDKFDLNKYPQYKTFITDYITNFIKNESNNTLEQKFINNIGSTCSPTDSFPCTPCDTTKLPLNKCTDNKCTLDDTYCSPDPLGGFIKRAGIGSFKPQILNEITKLNDPKDKTINDLLSKLHIEKNILKPEYFDFLIKELSSSPNRLTEEINLKVKEELCICIGFLITIALIINIVPIKLFKYCNNTITSIIGELIVVFVLIGIIEVWFFKNVATKFVPTKPSLIVQTFKDKLLSIING